MSTADFPEREFDILYDREGFPIATSSLEDSEGTSNDSDSESEDMSNPSNPTEKPPRREVRWLDLGAKNQSLESIKQLFDHFLSSSSSLLRHITSPTDNKLRHNLHQCRGYLREEITLASDVSKSVIISHAFPSQSEVCSICGKLVQYESTEPSIVDGKKREANSPDGSHHSLLLQPSGNPLPHSPIVDPPSSVSSDMSDSGSILIPSPLSPPLSNHDHPSLQLRDNGPDEISGLSSPGLLNSLADTSTRHRPSQESLDADFGAWGPPTLSEPSRSVHFVPNTDQLARDNKPEEESQAGPSSHVQSLFNPDTGRAQVRRHRKLSNTDSGWIPRRSLTLSSHSGPSSSGPSRSNNPEENLFRHQTRKGSDAASSNNVVKKNALDDNSHTKIPDNSPGGRRPLSGFFSSLATMLARKSSVSA
jgi:hypothetical protein